MKHRSGRLELICGSMFSGKTEELIRRLRRASIAQQQVQVFKHSLDQRYDEIKLASHSGADLAALPVTSAAEILANLRPETTVVGIDEVQFFDYEIVALVQELADRSLRVVMAGLDLDFRGEPFGPIPYLLSVAEYVDKYHAICMVCGEDACRTQRLVNGQPAYYDDPVILVGARESYEPRCREHHLVPHREPQAALADRA
ncbi:MAG: thymidine kinase [Anaerolineae bacterium]|nr:thymidine kinase [Anaerolineae bacterium]